MQKSAQRQAKIRLEKRGSMSFKTVERKRKSSRQGVYGVENGEDIIEYMDSNAGRRSQGKI